MRRPDQWPMVPFAGFVDTVGPSVNGDFLNPLQEGLQDLWGGLLGKSATLVGSEFIEQGFPGGFFGRFSNFTATNIQQAVITPTGPGQHGVWKTVAAANGAATYECRDAPSWIDTLDFAFSGRAAVTKKAALATAGTEGFAIGLRMPPAVLGKDCLFIAGNDKANWQVVIGSTMADTTVPVVDGQFYSFQATRIQGTVYCFIDGALTNTLAFPDLLTGMLGVIKMFAPTALAQDGFLIDYHRAWYQR